MLQAMIKQRPPAPRVRGRVVCIGEAEMDERPDRAALARGTPGLKLCVASSGRTAYGLLRSAIEDPDPVVVLEPRILYGVLFRNVIYGGAGQPPQALQTRFLRLCDERWKVRLLTGKNID